MKTLYSISKTEVSEEQIERDRLFRVFVFGLPRSGTSLMTNICQTLGVNMIHTTEEKKEKYDKKYKEQFGEYHPNEGGFFEIAENFLEHYIDILGTPYSGCKMIIPVIGLRWELIKLIPSKVIMMWRDPKEIKESQEAFYSNQSDEAYLRTALINQKMILEKWGKEDNDFIVINHRDLINFPKIIVLKVAEFIHSNSFIEESIALVKPERHRFKKENIKSEQEAYNKRQNKPRICPIHKIFHPMECSVLHVDCNDPVPTSVCNEEPYGGVLHSYWYAT